MAARVRICDPVKWSSSVTESKGISLQTGGAALCKSSAVITSGMEWGAPFSTEPGSTARTEWSHPVTPVTNTNSASGELRYTDSHSQFTTHYMLPPLVSCQPPVFVFVLRVLPTRSSPQLSRRSSDLVPWSGSSRHTYDTYMCVRHNGRRCPVQTWSTACTLPYKRLGCSCHHLHTHPQLFLFVSSVPECSSWSSMSRPDDPQLAPCHTSAWAARVIV